MVFPERDILAETIGGLGMVFLEVRDIVGMLVSIGDIGMGGRVIVGMWVSERAGILVLVMFILEEASLFGSIIIIIIIIV